MVTTDQGSLPPERHVAVVPLPLASHPASLLSLVVRLALSSPNTHFSFLTTPNCNASLFNSSSTTLLPSNIKPYVLGDPRELDPIELRAGAESIYFLDGMAAGNLQTALQAVAADTGKNITCLLTDAVLSLFAAKACAELDLPWIAVWSPSPCALSACIHAELALQGSSPDALDSIPGLPGTLVADHWPSEVFFQDSVGLSVVRQALRGMLDALPRASAVVLNSFHELSANHDLESRFKILYPGFHTVLPQPAEPDPDPSGCLSWLDRQKADSVAYISFGTMLALSEDELVATAEALEVTGTPFLWSLPDSERRLLPSGFGGRGVIVPWVDQARVLRHGAVGVHVTHCGLNSVNESIAAAVPMIGRPFWVDNPMNAVMLEEVWKIGVCVNNGGALTKAWLVEALEKVLKREEGKMMMERVRKMREVVLESSGPTGTATRDYNALMGLIG